MWQQVEKEAETDDEKLSRQESEPEEGSAAEGEHSKGQIMEAKNINGYDEWKWKYAVTWKGFSDTTGQGVQDLVSAESLVEEYWADPDLGVKK